MRRLTKMRGQNLEPPTHDGRKANFGRGFLTLLPEMVD